MHSIVSRLIGSPQEVTKIFCSTIGDGSGSYSTILGVLQADKRVAANKGGMYLNMLRTLYKWS